MLASSKAVHIWMVGLQGEAGSAEADRGPNELQS